MGSCHIAHDCKIGNDNIFANNTLFAGHVVVEVSSHFTMIAFFTFCWFKSHFYIDKTLLFQDCTHTAGAVVVHQFCHIGSFSFLGGGSVVCWVYKYKHSSVFGIPYNWNNLMAKK